MIQGHNVELSKRFTFRSSGSYFLISVPAVAIVLLTIVLAVGVALCLCWRLQRQRTAIQDFDAQDLV
jgi:hypothetical protein